MQNHARISINSNKMSGVPCIRDLRMPVGTILAMLADKITVEEILKSFPDLEPEDITEALQFAADAMEETEFWRKKIA